MNDRDAPGGPDQPSNTRTRGLDLLVALDRTRATPLRAQLEDAVRTAVRDGRLSAGVALPSTRALAVELGISRGVVVEAYGQLAADGFLEIRAGGATRVAAVPPVRGAEPRRAAPRPSPAPIDLLPMSGDLVAFPRRAWVRAVRRGLDATSAPDLSYGDLRGPGPAREALAAYLGRSRGVLATTSTTAFTGGVAESIAAVAGVLKDRGARRIAVEDPGFGLHRTTLRTSGLEPVPVPVDDGGLRVEALERAAVDAVLVTPAHQSPTGVPLAPDRRAALVRWASDHGTTVIEDDYDGEFRYDRQAVGALQALAPDHVAYTGSVSKTLSPALRIGWLVAPAALLDAAMLRRAVGNGGADVLGPQALAALIGSGDYDRHLRARRRDYAARRVVVLQEVRRLLPDATTMGIAAGLHVAVVLPETIDAAALTAAAYERGALLAAVHATIGRTGVTLVTLGFGRTAEDGLRRGVAVLAEAVEAVRGRCGRAGPALP